VVVDPKPNIITTNEPIARADVTMVSGRVAQIYFPESTTDADLASLAGWMLQHLRADDRAAQRRARLMGQPKSVS
jgi:hypothetical protein